MTVFGGTQVVSDTTIGTRGDDLISGQSGDDYLHGGRGNDTIIGGSGSDVLTGGLDADTFVWSAGHIQNGVVDYVTDFSIQSGDTLSFLDSNYGAYTLNVLSAELSYTSVTEFNGIDLGNNLSTGTDIIFTIENAHTGAVQQIVLLDAWSRSLDSLWDDFFASKGLCFDFYAG